MRVTRRAATIVLAEIATLRLRLSGDPIGAACVYHRVGSPQGDPERGLVPTHGVDLFAAQVRYLRRRYRLVLASELWTAVLSRRRGQKIPVALTLDDDLREHASNALRVLQRLGAPATFFLCGASLQAPSTFWWEWLEAAARNGVLPDAIAAPSEIGGREASIQDVALRVQRLPRRDRERVVQQLAEGVEPGALPGGMSADDVERLAVAGFEVGFHTLRHDELPPLDESSLHASLTDGREDLIRITGERLRAIAYPHGSADERVARAARRVGYEAGFTTSGRAVSPSSDPMLMGRVTPSVGSVAECAWQVVRALGSEMRAHRRRARA